MFGSTIYKYGTSAANWLLDINSDDIKNYGKESVTCAISSLFSFPPDPLPLVTLIAAIFTTVAAGSKLIQGKGFRLRETVLVIGSWGGHHAVMETRTQKELNKIMETVSVKLDQAEDQIDRWEDVMEQETENIKTMETVSENFQGGAAEITRASTVLKEGVGVQETACAEYSKLVSQMKEGAALAGVVLEEHQVNAEKISEVLAERIKKIKEVREEQLKIVELQKKLEKRIIVKINKLEKLKKETCNVQQN